ncbi:MAG: sigma-70 family RNA polymerase sigma factor [Lachnospiraceae bacterium]|nr:sigma-70 family RNA polymerase sigma factor [Lachnospiraceae bacterium]
MRDLIKEAKRKDPDAFMELMQQHMQSMYKVSRSILHSDEDVADAIQDTILACWEKLPQLNEEKYFKTWMIRILVNKCNDLIRKKELLQGTAELTEEGNYDREYENVEWKEVLESLEEKYRLILMLYYVESLTTKEIGKVLDIPEATVRTRLTRGRSRLSESYLGKAEGRG